MPTPTYGSAMRWNELPPGNDFAEVIEQLRALEARALKASGGAAPCTLPFAVTSTAFAQAKAVVVPLERTRATIQ